MPKSALEGWNCRTGVLLVALNLVACGRTTNPDVTSITNGRTDATSHLSSSGVTATAVSVNDATSRSGSGGGDAEGTSAGAEGTTEGADVTSSPSDHDSTAGGSRGETNNVDRASSGDGGATTNVASSGAHDAGGAAPDPFAPRSGSFKMLVYSRTVGFRTYSIPDGQKLLQQIADERGFEITLTEDPYQFTRENLDAYEAVFFLNTSWDVLNATEEAAFEDWITGSHGAFIGLGRAADTERTWPFYKELTGQYYNGHSCCVHEQNITWDSDALDFPAVRGMPSPWPHADLWFKFNDFETWSSKPGFKILSWLDFDFSGTGAETVRMPVSFVREWSTFRAFNTALGYPAAAYQDPWFKRHIEAGILWAVRREHWLE